MAVQDFGEFQAVCGSVGPGGCPSAQVVAQALQPQLVTLATAA
jgi:hypothetical protein